MPTARCVIDARAALGETPVWSAAENRLYWIDCIAGAIHRYDPVADEDTLMPIEVEGYLGSISLRAEGGLLLLAGKALWALDAGWPAAQDTAKGLLDARRVVYVRLV